MNGKKRNSDTWNVIRYKRAVPKQNLKDLGTVLLFCILFPYVVATFGGRVQKTELTVYTDDRYVRRETQNGTEQIPLNTYLLGALAASIDTDMEEETLKAQAVVLRTAFTEAYDRRENKEENFVDERELGQEAYSIQQMRRMWTKEFTPCFEKIRSAVEETDGVIMTYHGIAVKAPYFYLSGGKTRDGNELFGQEAYPYLQSVESEQDFSCPEFSSRTVLPEEVFEEQMSTLFGETGTDIGQYELIRDTAGYVTDVSLNEKKIQGEEFRRSLSLPSASFKIEKTEKGICITAKGKGHGIGFDQYGANEMAETGKLYGELLKYYFTDIEIQKAE